MDTKKLMGAIVAAFVILFMAGFLVHNVWLGTTYRQMRDGVFVPPGRRNAPQGLGHLGE